MTVSMIARHKVNDFATWKKGYDETAQFRKDGGVTADSVHRALDDPNMVVVYHQFADASTAKAFGARVNSDEFRTATKDMGIDLGTMEIWTLEDVE